MSSIGSAACCSVARCPESELGTCSLRGAALPLQRGAAPDQLTQICNRCDYNPSFAQRLRKQMKDEQEEGERGMIIESGERAGSSRAGQPLHHSCHQ